MSKIAVLADRGVVELTGADRVPFLQGLVSNDVTLAMPGVAVWAALLTAQGKWLADFFILTEQERLLLECERAQADMLVRTLGRYRLRSKVALADVSAQFVSHVAWGAAASLPASAIAAPDPRLPDAGFRILTAQALSSSASEAEWHAHRITLGLPDGSRDLESGKTLLLEAGFDELGGISWTKGCYMGQELTARTRYRGLLKRRLIPISCTGPTPAPGSAITQGGAEVGSVRSGVPGLALATLRLDTMENTVPLMCEAASLTPLIPGWMRLPERG
jgi:folate-binding protein YgfZ